MDEKELNDLTAKCEEYLNGWKRAKADFLNYQKDEAKRFEHVIRFSNEEVVKDLITVLDSFELALAAHPAERGFFMVKSQLEDVLKKQGLEKVAVTAGEPFNPSLHESILSVESDQSTNTVVEEVEKGYTLHGKVIRPARVKVAK